MSTYTTPVVKEVQNKEWVSYGEDNNYFQYLIERYNGSPTNNAIINGIVELMYGRGIDATDSNRKPEQYAQMRALFKKNCLRKLVSDYKMMGQCAMQVIYNDSHDTIVQVDHLPIETLRAEKCNEDGDIEGYYYAKSWKDVKDNKEKPMRIPAFGCSEEAIEIVYIKPYRAGFYYYSPVDYQGGLQYAELEEEIANYHINNIKNGLAPSMLINFNNGVPTEEQQDEAERRIAEKFSGSSNAGRFIVSFNDNKELAADITPVQLSDASQQYQFLADESMKKLMVAHRVTSPMLLGIKDNSGLGNNAQELETASVLFENTVIEPMQEVILDGIHEILAFNDISLNLYFKTLRPLEWSTMKVGDAEIIEEETGVKVKDQKRFGKFVYLNEDDPCWEGYEMIGFKEKNGKKVPNCVPISLDKDNPCWEGYEMIGTKIKNGREVPNCVPKLNAEMAEKITASLIPRGEEMSAEWELIDERPVDYDKEELRNAAFTFAEVIQSTPSKTSEQDTKIIKVRYKYTSTKQAVGASRDFCSMMESANKVYRMEDILDAEGSNEGFGPNGSDFYSIWFYKGGPFCQHYWMRQTYLRKSNERITVTEARELINKLDPELRSEARLIQNAPEVAKAPRDMPDSGYLNPPDWLK